MTVCNFIFLVFISLSCFAQAPVRITIQKDDCCDSLSIKFANVYKNDSVTYSKMINQGGLGVYFRNCIYNAKASIVSFEITINQEQTQFVKGNVFDFKKLVQLKSGGEITFTNCIVSCKNELYEPKTIVLPKRKIIVSP